MATTVKAWEENIALQSHNTTTLNLYVRPFLSVDQAFLQNSRSFLLSSSLLTTSPNHRVEMLTEAVLLHNIVTELCYLHQMFSVVTPTKCG